MTPLPNILKNYPLSPSQQTAALTRTGDVVVRAGAGTGKTRTLVGRYLALLSDEVPLRNIVAMTFTRKAAREMRNRVRQEITAYLEQPDLPEKERRFWETSQNRLDAARISTIHGICGEILRAHPAEANVDPRFDLLDETASALLMRDTVETTLAWAITAEAMAPLIEVLSEKELVELIESLLKNKDDIADSLVTFPKDGVLPVWQARLTAEKSATLSAILQKPEILEAWDVLRSCVPLDSNDKQGANRNLVVEFLTQPLEQQLNTVDAVIGINFQGGSGKAWSGGTAEKKEVMAALKVIREPLKSDPILQISLNEADEAWANLIPVIVELFVVLSRTFQQKKDQLEALDFDDLEKRAVELLENHPSVQKYWQSQVKALLVDEFQDTNERQLRLVRLLCQEPGRLFIVGDAKQSIYRFRGADVTVFRGEEAAIETAGGQTISLDTSYRAHADLLDGMNQLLKPVLGEDGPHRKAYEAPFEKLNPGTKAAKNGVPHPHIEFHVALGNKAEAFPAAVRGLVGRLQDLVASSELGWGDIAILCRSSGAFATYEDILDEVNIPYLTVSGKGFLDRPEIRDLLNALRAISDPHDDIALVGLLRSPACGLSDVDLFHLLNGREKGQSLWNVVQTGIFWPAEVDQERLSWAFELIDGLNQQSGRMSAADIFKLFLDQTNYRAMLRSAGMSRSLRNVSKLLADVHNSELISLSAFLDAVIEMKDSGSRTGEARSTAKGAVQLMSIHASKGLEFPVVVLGDAGSSGRNQTDLLVYPQLWIMFPGKQLGRDYVKSQKGKVGVVELAKSLEKAQADAEKDRLLYVALTRAEQMLFISGTGRNGAKGASFGGWLGQLGEIIGLSGEIPADYDEAGGKTHPLNCMLGDLQIGGACYEPNVSIPAVNPPAPP
ncbi:MAG: ATP-dependent helicase/nuclease subunit A, partial [Candidatus Promineifilaceae bacterium]